VNDLMHAARLRSTRLTLAPTGRAGAFARRSPVGRLLLARLR